MIKTLAQTHTANIYGVYIDRRLIGTVEIKLIGPDAGMHAYSINGKYTKSDIKKMYRKEAKTC